MIFQDPYASLNPRWAGTRYHCRADPGVWIGDAAERGTGTGWVVTRPGRADAARRREIPARVFWRQRQRISIARALASEPDFLVCDEPTARWTFLFRPQILNLMRDLQLRLGLTYLFISHNLAVVRHMADRLGVMYLGRIVEQGPAETIFQTAAPSIHTVVA